MTGVCSKKETIFAIFGHHLHPALATSAAPTAAASAAAATAAAAAATGQNHLPQPTFVFSCKSRPAATDKW